MFIIQQTTSGRHRIGCLNCDDYAKLPRDIGTAIHWVTFATPQDAFAQAAAWWFQICDRK